MKYLQMVNMIRSARGTCYVELALTVPLLLCLSFGTLELSNLFRAQQILSSICREGANAAFRECASAPDVNVCLAQSWNKVQGFASTVTPGAELVLSVYQLDSSSGTDQVKLLGLAGIDTRTGKTAIGQNVSRFTPGPADPQNPDPPNDLYRAIPHGSYPLNQSLTSVNRVLAISEVFYTYNPRVSSAGPLFRLLPISFYEVSIF